MTVVTGVRAVVRSKALTPEAGPQPQVLLLPPLHHPPLGAGETGGSVVHLFRPLLATATGFDGSRIGVQAALGSTPELSQYLVHPLCQMWLQKSQQVGRSGLGHSQSWCHLQGQDLGLGSSMPPLSLMHSTAWQTEQWSEAQDRFGHQFGLPFLPKFPTAPLNLGWGSRVGPQWAALGEDVTAVTRAHTGAVMHPTRPCTPEPVSPTVKWGDNATYLTGLWGS